MELSDSLSLSSDDQVLPVKPKSIGEESAKVKVPTPELATENERVKHQVEELKTRVAILKCHPNDSDDGSLSSSEHDHHEIFTRTTELERIVERRSRKPQVYHEMVVENRQLSCQIRAFLEFLGTRAGREVTSIDDAIKFYTELSEAAESRAEEALSFKKQVHKLGEKLQEKERQLHHERKQRKLLERQISEQTHNDSDDSSESERESLSDIKRKYKQKLEKMSEVIESQKDEIDSLNKSLDTMKELSIVRPDVVTDEITNMKQIYEAKIHAISEKMSSIEDLIAQKDIIQEQLELANREVNEECAELECQVAELKEKLEEKDEEIKNWQIVTKKWREESEKTVSVAKMLEADVAEYQTTIHELQLELSEAKMAHPSPPPIQNDRKYEILCEENENLRQAIESFEKLIEDQANEITEGHKERGKLLNQMANLSRYMSVSEATIQDLVHEKEQLLNESDRLKDDLEESQRRDYNEFLGVVNELRVEMPEIAERLEGAESLRKSEILSECVSALVEQLDKTKAGESSIREAELVETLKKKYNGVLMHLESAYKFLKNMGGSRAFATEEEKTALLTECARIGKFLEENDITIPDYSIFNPTDLNDPLKIARVFADFVTDEELHESPLWELYILFMCVAQVNQILMGNVEANEKFVREAQRITAQEKDERQLLKELDEWRARQIAINTALLPVLQKCTSTDDDDFELLTAKFVEAYANDQIPWPQRELLNAEVDQLTRQIEILQTKLEEHNQQVEKDREAFCAQAGDMVEDIERDVRNNYEEQARENEELKQVVSELRAQLEEAPAIDEESIRKAQKKIEKKQAEIRALTDEAEQMRIQATELQSALGELTVSNCQMQEQLSQMEEKLAASEHQISHQRARKREYKTKLLEEETNNTEKLQQLMKRNVELSEKFSQHVSHLENENRELKADVHRLTEECDWFDELRQQFRMENAKLQVQNRTLSLKLAGAAQSLERERETNAARQTAITAMVKAQSSEQIDKLSKDLKRCCDVLHRILTKETRETSIDGLIESVNAELDRRGSEQFIMADARNIRRILKLDDSSSVVDVFRDVDKELASLQRQLESEQEENKRLREHDDFLQRENAKLEQMKTEMTAWTTWSRSMLHQLSSTANANMPIADVRYALEEALLTSIGHRMIRRKMEILRVEKRILKSEHIRAIPVLHDKITSIRPIVLVLFFAKRIEEMNGSLPIRFGCLTKHDIAQSLRTSKIPVIPMTGE